MIIMKTREFIEQQKTDWPTENGTVWSQELILGFCKYEFAEACLCLNPTHICWRQLQQLQVEQATIVDDDDDDDNAADENIMFIWYAKYDIMRMQHCNDHISYLILENLSASSLSSSSS